MKFYFKNIIIIYELFNNLLHVLSNELFYELFNYCSIAEMGLKKLNFYGYTIDRPFKSFKTNLKNWKK